MTPWKRLKYCKSQLWRTVLHRGAKRTLEISHTVQLDESYESLSPHRLLVVWPNCFRFCCTFRPCNGQGPTWCIDMEAWNAVSVNRISEGWTGGTHGDQERKLLGRCGRNWSWITLISDDFRGYLKKYSRPYPPRKFNSSIAPEKLPFARKGSSSNHHFSGSMLNFGCIKMRKSHPSKGGLMTLFFLFRLVSKAGRCKATAEITLLGVRHGSSFFVEAQINVQRNTEIHQTYNKWMLDSFHSICLIWSNYEVTWRDMQCRWLPVRISLAKSLLCSYKFTIQFTTQPTESWKKGIALPVPRRNMRMKPRRILRGVTWRISRWFVCCKKSTEHASGVSFWIVIVGE